MKKLIISLLSISLILVSCIKDPEPEPEEIRAYVSIVSLFKESNTITWVVDEVEIQAEQEYGARVLGAVILASDAEEISFAAKNSDTGSLIESLLLTMEKDKYYQIVLYGSSDEPVLSLNEVETTRPQDSHVKFHFLHAATSLDSIDVYMGGTEVEDKVVSDLSFTEYSEYFEVLDYLARNSVTVTVHGDAYDPEKEILNYDYNDLIVSGMNYLSVFAYATGDPLDSEPKLWLYDLPTP